MRLPILQASARLSPAGPSFAPGIENQALVPWWSITKAVLAAAVLRLSDSGRLDLDDRYEDWPFTIRQLLQHRSGLTNYGGPTYQAAVASGQRVWPVEELLSRRQARKLIFEPGKTWAYSNIGYYFIRTLIERRSGQDIDSALRALVFRPLGIGHTCMAFSPADMASTYWGNDTHYDPCWVYHGLLVGPPLDAVKFLNGLLCGQLLHEATLRAMLQAHPVGGAISDRPWTQCSYGLGLMTGTMAQVGQVIGHSGLGHDTASALYAFPDLSGCPIVAAFCSNPDEGIAEWACLHSTRAMT